MEPHMLKVACLALMLCTAFLHAPAFGQEARRKIVFYCTDPVAAFVIADVYAQGFEEAAELVFSHFLNTGECLYMGFPRPTLTLKTRGARFGPTHGWGGWVWGVSHGSSSKVLGYIGIFDTSQTA